MKNRGKVLGMNYLLKNFHFVCPSGKSMPPHLLRCQRLAVVDYSLALGRLSERSGDPACREAEAPSTFAQLGLHTQVPYNMESATNEASC
jgi:hypothetical protein